MSPRKTATSPLYAPTKGRMVVGAWNVVGNGTSAATTCAGVLAPWAADSVRGIERAVAGAQRGDLQ